MKRLIAFMLALVMMAAVMAGCSPKEPVEPVNERPYVITTSFAYYDFLKNIVKDRADIDLLLPEGERTEDYHPSADDLKKIKQASVIVYTSRNFDTWIDNVRNYLGAHNILCCELSRCVEIKTINGAEKMDATSKLDYYVWLSPANAMKIVDELSQVLSMVDEANETFYKQNATAYIEELAELDEDLKEISEYDGRVSGMVFPETAHFGYMTHSYGIKCISYKQLLEEYSDDEAADEYRAFVKENNIDTMYYSNLDDIERINNSLSNLGLKYKRELYTCIRPTDAEIAEGVTYLELMEENIENIKKGFHMD